MKHGVTLTYYLTCVCLDVLCVINLLLLYINDVSVSDIVFDLLLV